MIRHPRFRRHMPSNLATLLTLDQYCAFCGEKTDANHPLCLPCHNELPWLPQEENTPVTGCDNAVSAFAYQPPISNLLLAIKFGKNLSELSTMGKLAANGILPQIHTIPEAILPVPLHANRLHTRGFNQALELARPLAHILGIPLLTHTVTRGKATTAQTELNAQQRQQNLHQAFSLATQPPYRHIVIFDDVISTGTTIGELANLLRAHGIAHIEAWSCARPVLRQKHEVMQQID